MKRLIALVLVAVMVLGLFAGCGGDNTPTDTSTTPSTTVTTPSDTTPADDDGLANALAYVKAMYKNADESTPKDYTVVSSVPVGDKTYTITWSVDVAEDIAKVVVGDDGTVTIDVNEALETETAYVLTATVADEAGNTKTVSFNHVIPAVISGADTEIVDMAYALETGESLPNEVTLSGVIISINTPYDSGYQNITVTIAVEGREDKPIMCYRLKGEGADGLAIGDTITVTGTLTNYNGTIEFTSGCTLDAVVKGEGETPVAPDSAKQIVEEAYALSTGASLAYTATLTGKITKINTPYDGGYKNITVTIVVDGCEDKPIVCYRLKGEGADGLAIGDTITVTGVLMNYSGTIEFGSGCTLDKVVKGGGTAPVAPNSEKEIVDEAYALEAGESLPYNATLTGKITKINTPYDSGYQNITVTIAVSGREDKPIVCFRLKGEGAEDLAVGDTITVTGALMNYNGTIEFGSGCTLDKVVKGGGTKPTAPSDPKQIVDEAYALEAGESLDYTATLTGEITKINTPYDSNYKNVTVTIAVSGREDKPIVCFRLKGEGADTLAVGDTITVTGTLMNYGGTIEFGSGCTLDKVVKGEGSAPETPTEPEDPEENPGTGVSPSVDLATGDKVVIYAPAYGMALSATKAGYYNAGVAVTITDGVMSGYGATEIWTVTVNEDGTYSFANGGQNIGLAASYSSMDLGAVNDDWVLEDLGGGLYNVKNAVRGNYMEWFASYSNWSTYASTSAATDDQFQISFYVVTLEPEAPVEPETPVDPEEPTDPVEPEIPTDPVEIVKAAYALEAGASLPYTATLSGEITAVNTPYSETYGNITVTIVVEGAEDMPIVCFRLKGEGADALAVGDTITVTGTLMNYNGTIEFTSGCTLDNVVKGETPTDPEEPETPEEPEVPALEAPFADGDQVVIYNPANGVALSSTKSGYNNAGVAVTVAEDGTLTGYGATEVWTVIVNEDGTYSFSYEGQNIGLAESYSSTSLGAVNDKWELSAAEGQGLYLLRNTGRDMYLEWYSAKNYWSCYKTDTVASDPLYQLSFYVVPEETEPETPEESVAAVPYLFYVEQVNLGKTLYFNGSVSSGYLQTTENVEEAVYVYMEETEEGVRFYFLDGETKTYIEIFLNENNKVRMQLVTEATMYYTYSEEAQTYVATINGTDYYAGTYGTYNTISASSTYYITGENAANVGSSQFVAKWEAVTTEEETETPAEGEDTEETPDQG